MSAGKLSIEDGVLFRGAIKRARARTGLSLADVGRALGCSRQAVAIWESGKNGHVMTEASLPTALKLARYWGLSLDEIFGLGAFRSDK